MNKKHRKHVNNEVFLQEERQMQASVNKSILSKNAQIIGRNGELLLLEFLRKYLPSTLRVFSGKFISPTGKMSPQIDIMVVDSRSPLLCRNLDESVIVMLHSVLATIEVKTSITKREILAIKKSHKKIKQISLETFPIKHGFTSPSQYAFIYNMKHTLKTTIEAYFDNTFKELNELNLFISRIHIRNKAKDVGMWLRYEQSEHIKHDGYKHVLFSYVPLADFYYSLVQDSYYALGSRDYGFMNIGEHLGEYMDLGIYNSFICKTTDNFEFKQKNIN